MSRLNRIGFRKGSLSCFVVIAVILLAGFVGAVYYIKHSIASSHNDTSISESNKIKITDKSGSPSASEKVTTSSSNNNSMTQTGLPNTGLETSFYQLSVVFILTFLIVDYYLSVVGRAARR